MLANLQKPVDTRSRMSESERTSPLPSASVFEVFVVSDGGTQRVVASGELDMATSPLLEARFHAVSAHRVLLDLRAVTFIDSTGLRVVMDTYDMLGPRLVITASAPVARMFKLVGVHDRLPLLDT